MVIDLGMGKGARTHVLHTTHHLPQSNTTAAPPPGASQSSETRRRHHPFSSPRPSAVWLQGMYSSF